MYKIKPYTFERALDLGVRVKPSKNPKYKIDVFDWNKEFITSKQEKVYSNAEYIYGDTDSVFFHFHLEDEKKQKIIGKKALEISIEIAQEACHLVSKFLKKPHDFEYEKTFMPFCLLSKKRYVGILYELDPNKGKRKEMGIVLKRRDNAPIVKDIYGGLIDILMKEQDILKAVGFLKECLTKLISQEYSKEKLIISKSLNSFYKNPQQIAHKVLADRITSRDPGNKPNPGDRIPFIYIIHKNKNALQGERIETPTYIQENNLKIDYSFYITNQIMKPVLQLFSLVLEDIWKSQNKLIKINKFKKEVELIKSKHEEKKWNDKIEQLKNKEVQLLLFDSFLRTTNNLKNGNQSIVEFFQKNIKN
jgi:DNA polymerase elongation subunit (family B)